MARISDDTVIAEVTAKLTTAGGKMTNEALYNALESDGKGAYIPIVQRLAKAGQLVKQMEFFPEGATTPVPVFSLP